MPQLAPTEHAPRLNEAEHPDEPLVDYTAFHRRFLFLPPAVWQQSRLTSTPLGPRRREFLWSLTVRGVAVGGSACFTQHDPGDRITV